MRITYHDAVLKWKRCAGLLVPLSARCRPRELKRDPEEALGQQAFNIGSKADIDVSDQIKEVRF